MVYGFDDNLNKIEVKDKASQETVDAGQDQRLSALESGKADKSQIPDVSGFATKTELAGKSDSDHTHTQYATKDELAGKSDTSHTHTDYALKSEIPDISGKSDVGHTHDDRYYTESEVESKLSGRLPNFTNNIGSTNAGNPRQVKFISVDYNTVATYFKMSAMCCHDNGVSYQFLEDIIIGVTTSGTITCNVYKYCQQSCGTESYNLVDGLERQYGDVFYTIDETAKVVDFYILMGQYSLGQFTPPTKIGNTSLSYVTPLTGTPVYHSSGTRIWANGNGTTYATKNDIPTITISTEDPSGGKDGDIWFKYKE